MTGLEVASLFRQALELIEPGLPALTVGVTVDGEPGSPGYQDALFLAQRGLLPSSWDPEQLTLPVWQEMVRVFMDWYRLDPIVVRAPDSETVVVADMSLVLARVAKAVRPAALIAGDPSDQEQISFLGVIWNWSVYPRLLVVRPNPGLSRAQGFDDILASLSSCALTLNRYIFAPEPTARRLFLGHVEARMVVVGARPGQAAAWPRLIEQGRELEALSFAHSAVADLELFTAVFVGPQTNPVQLLTLLPQVRTNMSPRTFLRHMQTP